MPPSLPYIEKAKGRPLLQWVGKKPLESVEFYPAQEKEVYGDKSAKEFNKLFWGDNLQVLSHLLKEYRGKIDLIYIDPPFDSKADYVKRVQLRGEVVEGVQQGLLEEKQYSDIWEKDEFLQFMYERLLLMKGLLSETGSIFVHLDWHKSSYVRLILDEIFGEDRFVNEIIWHYADNFQGNVKGFATNHNNILWYSNTDKYTSNKVMVDLGKTVKRDKRIWSSEEKKLVAARDEQGKIIYADFTEKKADDVWEIGQSSTTKSASSEYLGYPTQKPEALLERIIRASTNEGDVIADFFMGSGTTQAVAQKLGRKWLGCDINLGAVQMTSKRLGTIISKQEKDKNSKLLNDFKGSLGFKVLNVNDYDVFKNEIEAKEIVMEMYGVEPIKRTYFDGVMDKNFVKVMPLNRVFNKADIRSLLKNIGEKIDGFTVKTKSKSGEPVYEEGVIIVCSGMELDVLDFLKKENKTGIKVDVRDILTDKKNLIFKKKPEAKLLVKTRGMKLNVEVKDFFSPILMRKLEVENERTLSKKQRAKVGDYKQIIDSVAVDVDYNGKLFNAEVMDLPTKKEVIKGTYQWDYPKKGKYTVAVKIVDVLGEEYFETFEVEAK